jgi:hypothetical protein
MPIDCPVWIDADHDLVRGDAPLSVLRLEQRLRDDGDERLRQHRPHHVLFRCREHVDDAVDRLGGRARVQRREHEVTGLRRRHREANRLEVAHFTDQDVIGIFAQRRAQRVRERQRVRAELALVDQALLRLVQELDRVLDREDVAEFVLVDVVHHRRECRRLARAGRSRDEDQPAWAVGEVGEDLRRIELLERKHLRRNRPERRRGAAMLVERIDPEAGEVRHREAEVAFEELLVHLPLRVAHDVVHHGVHVLVLHRRQVDAPDVAVYADQRWKPRGQVKVRGLVLDRESEQFGDIHASDTHREAVNRIATCTSALHVQQ